MRGGHVHNKVLLPPVITHCRALKASLSLEHPVKVGSRSGAVDILAEFNSWRLVIEAENTCRRIDWDIQKAWSLEADALLIVVPNTRVAHACRWEARQKTAGVKVSRLEIHILTLGVVHQWLSDYFRLISAPIEAFASKTFPGQNTRPGSTPNYHL